MLSYLNLLGGITWYQIRYLFILYQIEWYGKIFNKTRKCHAYIWFIKKIKMNEKLFIIKIFK